MNRTAGALIVAAALFALWAQNTGRLAAIEKIISQGPEAATAGGKTQTTGLTLPASAAAPCSNIVSGACAGAIAAAATGGLSGTVTSILKGIFG